MASVIVPRTTRSRRKMRPQLIRLNAELKEINGEYIGYVPETTGTRTGPSPSNSRAFSYVWMNPTEVDSQRLAYRATRGVALKVQPQRANT